MNQEIQSSILSYGVYSQGAYNLIWRWVTMNSKRTQKCHKTIFTWLPNAWRPRQCHKLRKSESFTEEQELDRTNRILTYRGPSWIMSGLRYRGQESSLAGEMLHMFSIHEWTGWTRAVEMGISYTGKGGLTALGAVEEEKWSWKFLVWGTQKRLKKWQFRNGTE